MSGIVARDLQEERGRGCIGDGEVLAVKGVAKLEAGPVNLGYWVCPGPRQPAHEEPRNVILGSCMCLTQLSSFCELWWPFVRLQEHQHLVSPVPGEPMCRHIGVRHA